MIQMPLSEKIELDAVRLSIHQNVAGFVAKVRIGCEILAAKQVAILGERNLRRLVDESQPCGGILFRVVHFVNVISEFDSHFFSFLP